MNSKDAYIATTDTAAYRDDFTIARQLVKQLAKNRQQVREYVRKLPHLKERAEQQHADSVFETFRKLAETQPNTVAKIIFIADPADIPSKKDILLHVAVTVSVNSAELIARHLTQLGKST